MKILFVLIETCVFSLLNDDTFIDIATEIRLSFKDTTYTITTITVITDILVFKLDFVYKTLVRIYHYVVLVFCNL